MTLKELITQVGFDELLPCLKEHESEHLDNIYAFREAYDILRGMEPDRDFHEEARVEWSGGRDEGGKGWIGVYHLDDVPWEKALAKDIIVADDVNLSREELAMRCLWEITYWGFSPQDISGNFERKFGRIRPKNKYEEALDRLEESIWKRQTQRRLRFRGPDGERLTRLELPLKLGERRKNRAKRKREYRQDRREEYLKRMSAREDLVQMLSAEGSSFTRNDVGFLLGIAYGTRYDYRSVTPSGDLRAAYVLESMTRYQQLDLAKYDCAVVLVRHSSRYPFGEAELEAFRKAVSERLGYSEILFGTMAEDCDEKEITVTLLLNKR